MAVATTASGVARQVGMFGSHAVSWEVILRPKAALTADNGGGLLENKKIVTCLLMDWCHHTWVAHLDDVSNKAWDLGQIDKRITVKDK